VTWDACLQVEIIETFADAARQGHKRIAQRELRQGGFQSSRFGGPNLRGLNGGMSQAQLELLEALTVEPRVARAAKKRGLMSSVWKYALDALERDGLARRYQGWRGRQPVWCAEITRAGWKRLLMRNA